MLFGKIPLKKWPFLRFFVIIRPEKQFYFALSASNSVLLKLLYTNIQFKSRLNDFNMAEKSSANS
jgi:hypothetical protein